MSVIQVDLSASDPPPLPPSPSNSSPSHSVDVNTDINTYENGDVYQKKEDAEKREVYNDKHENKRSSGLLTHATESRNESFMRRFQSNDKANGNSMKKEPAGQSDQQTTSSFYDNLKRDTQEDRGTSLVYHLRNLNNWVKSVLISTYTNNSTCVGSDGGLNVLDLGCGKGGDIGKWFRQNLVRRYVGVDIAQKSLEDAVERVSKNKRMDPRCIRFIQGDLGVISLDKDPLHCWDDRNRWRECIPFSPNDPNSVFHICSMQFAFHYMFGSSQRANHFFSELNNLVYDGGYFIVTTIDPNILIQKLMQSCGSYEPDGSPSPIRLKDEKQREICTIEFDAATRNRLLNSTNATSGVDFEDFFGLRYHFMLKDSIDEEAVNSPEYLVPDTLMKNFARSHNFNLKLQQNFHSFINEKSSQYMKLLEKMNCLNVDGTISSIEWEIAGLYQVLVFQKC